MKTDPVAAPPEFQTIDLTSVIESDCVHETTIDEYFRTLDRGAFEATAELFAEQGCLNPPFEKSIAGREAIAQYLSKEAIGMSFCPESGQIVESEIDRFRYQIQGKVVTNYFTIGVGWSFDLNAAKEIMMVEIKLLASMAELLKIRD